jgi:hypothetical protein
MFVLPVPAWVVGVLIIGGNLMQMASSSSDVGPQTVAFDVHLAGAAFAILYFRLGWNLGTFLPDLAGLRPSWKPFRERPQLRVLDPDLDENDLDEEGDRLLIKVHREGEASLTAKERRILEEYSRRMRQKHHRD